MVAGISKDKVLYLFLMTLASFLGFSKLFVYSKLVSVESFGVYSLVLSLYIFLVFFGGMGIQEGLLKKGSMCFATRDVNSIKAYFLRGIVFSFSITSILGLFLIAISNIFIENNPTIVDLFSLGVLLALSTILFNVLDAFIRSQQKFILFAFILTVKNFIAISLGYLLAPEYGVKGLIISELISLTTVFISALIFFIRPSDVTLYKDKSVFELISNGYQMMLTLVLRNISIMMDRWFIAMAVGVTALGYYSFSMILLAIAMVLVSFLVTIKGPVWVSSFQSNNDTHELINNVNRVVYRAVLLLLLVSPVFLLNISKPLQLYYPEYANDTVFDIILIIYLSLFAVIPIYLYDWVFIATHQEGLLFKINIWSAMISVSLYALGWLAEANVVIYAVIFFITRVFLLMVYVYRIRMMHVF